MLLAIDVGNNQMASGFTMPGNIEAISAERSVDQRYSEYIAVWLGFAIVSMLPLLGALVALRVSRDRAISKLQAARGWLERNARTMAAVIIVLLAAALLRNGIVGLTS